jgi:hypothetical protein
MRVASRSCVAFLTMFVLVLAVFDQVPVTSFHMSTIIPPASNYYHRFSWKMEIMPLITPAMFFGHRPKRRHKESQ